MKAASRLPHVIAGVNDLQLAVSTQYVKEIIRTPQWHVIPNVAPHIRGVINLRGRVLPLLDLRLRMGLSSALEEIEKMVAMLSAREQDHVDWLNELMRAVTEGRPFTLARDPAKCAFGKWYYNYKPEDIGFASVMYRFETPHRRIHAIADEVLNHAEGGDREKAKEIILGTQNGDLSTVVGLFAEARDAFRESFKEVALVLTDGKKHLSLAVDRVISVEVISEDSMADFMPSDLGGAKSDLLRKVAHRANGESAVFVLNAEALLAGRY